MAAVFAFHTGEAIVQVAAFQIPVNDLLEEGIKEKLWPSLFPPP